MKKNKYMLEELIEGIEQPKAEYSSTDTVAKDRVLTVRVEPALYSLLESLTEEWNKAGVSDTVRTILSMYFLPAIYEHSWKELKPERVAQNLQEQKERGYSANLARLNRFVAETLEYLRFLKEAQERGKASLEYIEQVTEKIESIIAETEQTMEKAVEKGMKKI